MISPCLTVCPLLYSLPWPRPMVNTQMQFLRKANLPKVAKAFSEMGKGVHNAYGKLLAFRALLSFILPFQKGSHPSGFNQQCSKGRIHHLTVRGFGEFVRQPTALFCFHKTSAAKFLRPSYGGWLGCARRLLAWSLLTRPCPVKVSGH